MGFFSFETSDTKESIPNVYSYYPTFTVYLTSPDGRVWEESLYEGYGRFDGQCIYELIAELNTDNGNRVDAIDITFKNNPERHLYIAEAHGYSMPRLFKSKSLAYDRSKFYAYAAPGNCPYQGYFYND